MSSILEYLENIVTSFLWNLGTYFVCRVFQSGPSQTHSLLPVRDGLPILSYLLHGVIRHVTSTEWHSVHTQVFPTSGYLIFDVIYSIWASEIVFTKNRVTLFIRCLSVKYCTSFIPFELQGLFFYISKISRRIVSWRKVYIPLNIFELITIGRNIGLKEFQKM